VHKKEKSVTSQWIAHRILPGSINCLSVTLFILVQGFVGCPASAQEYTVLSPPVSLQAETQVAPPKTIQSETLSAPANGAQKPVEQQQVEAAMGVRDMSRDYQRYAAIFQNAPTGGTTFAGFLNDEYMARRKSGIVLAGVVAPILAGLTVMGSMLLYSHGKEDGGGFCSKTADSDPLNDCEGDRGELSGIIIISSLGGIATIAVFTPGIIKFAKYNKRARRIKPLVPAPVTQPQLSFGFGPHSFSARLVF
jgi:hypothetical protein